jgi:hypothetical protein
MMDGRSYFNFPKVWREYSLIGADQLLEKFQFDFPAPWQDRPQCEFCVNHG